MSKKNTNSNNTNTSPAATAGNKDMFCKLLRHYRQKKNLSQRELGLMLGLSRSGYANYENGACLPCIDQINLLSEILDYDFLFAFTRANASIASYEKKKEPAMLVCDNAGNYHYDSRFPGEAEDLQPTETIKPDPDQVELLRLYNDITDWDKRLIKEYMKLKRSTYNEQHMHIYEKPEGAE